MGSQLSRSVGKLRLMLGSKKLEGDHCRGPNRGGSCCKGVHREEKKMQMKTKRGRKTEGIKRSMHYGGIQKGEG